MRIATSTYRRSLTKGMIWESISTVATFGLAWMIFYRIIECSVFVTIYITAKFVLYCLYERMWTETYTERNNDLPPSRTTGTDG